MGYYSRANLDCVVRYRKSRARPKPQPVRELSEAERMELERRLRQRCPVLEPQYRVAPSDTTNTIEGE